MVTLDITQELAEKLAAIAARERRSVQAVLEEVITNYVPDTTLTADDILENPMLGLVGIITREDTQETDISATANESVAKYFADRVGNDRQ